MSEDTGSLKKSIVIKRRKSKNKNIIHCSVSPTGAEKNDGFYDGFIGFERVKMAAHPFMHPAFEKEGDKTIKTAKEHLSNQVTNGNFRIRNVYFISGHLLKKLYRSKES